MRSGLLGNTPSGTSNTNGLTRTAKIIHGDTGMATPASVNAGQAELFKVQQHVRGVGVDTKSSCTL